MGVGAWDLGKEKVENDENHDRVEEPDECFGEVLLWDCQ